MANKTKATKQETVTLESINTTLNVMNKKFDAIDRRFDAMDQKFDAMDQKFDAMDQKFDAMDQKFEVTDEKQDNFATELRRHGVLMEHLDSNVDLLAEGHIVLEQKIDGVAEELHEFKDDMNYKFEVVFGEFDTINRKLDGKVDRKEHERLEKRVTVLE